MIYITGDMHGDISSFKNPKLKKLGEKDYFIVCGDFGFLWDSESEKEKKNLEILKSKKYNICFVDGAHENFDMLNSYTPYRWKGGNVHKIADNIFHLMRGEIFTFEGKDFFVMGGGESEDRDMRTEGKTWWKAEMPDAQEIKNAEDNLKSAGYSVNYILTYEAPAIAKDFLKLQTNHSVHISPLNTYLQELMKRVNYHQWYFGSLHMDLDITKKMTAVFNKIYEIK
ncbi:MAG: metallophosphoesterase [Clostridiales bacterium]|nr:metallophosphoesterase [Clostridiales bacterium]